MKKVFGGNPVVVQSFGGVQYRAADLFEGQLWRTWRAPAPHGHGRVLVLQEPLRESLWGRRSSSNGSSIYWEVVGHGGHILANGRAETLDMASHASQYAATGFYVD